GRGRRSGRARSGPAAAPGWGRAWGRRRQSGAPRSSRVLVSPESHDRRPARGGRGAPPDHAILPLRDAPGVAAWDRGTDMGGTAAGDPAGGTGNESARLVRDALAHLADPAYLQTHALAGLVAPAGAGWSAGRAGEALRRRLLGAIAALEPPAKAGERGAARR